MRMASARHPVSLADREARGRLRTMSELDYGIFDGDNHYYEALDAFTRHLDPALGERVIEWVTVGRRRWAGLPGGDEPDDDVDEVVELMGDDRVIFGSDWPHIEALPEPTDYLAELRKFDAPTVRKIMRDNTFALTGPPRF